ncbi:MAG: hypothetical protein CTY18_02905 [Methylomonas sp.]|nr:MAG: hypothetical protein CTY18_02905 [Methylomonas sp.]
MPATLRQLIETRLRESTLFAEVSGAADLAAIRANRITNKGAYVIRKRRSSTGNNASQSALQTRTHQLSIFLVVHNVKSARGSDADDDNELLSIEVEQLLLGWVPDAAYNPLEFVSNQIVSFSNNFLIAEDIYQTKSIVRGLNYGIV